MKKEQRTGRPPRRQKPRVRSFYLPVALADYFRDNVRHPSHAVAGAMVTLLAIPEKYHSQLQDAALDLPPEEAIKAVRQLLPAIFNDMLMERHIQSMSPAERSRIIQVERKQLQKLER